MAFYNEMLSGFWDIITAPYKSLDALWVLLPLFVLWVVLEIYFARYKKEKLGWNTALANGITLSWLTLTGMRSLFAARPDDFWLRFIANMAILLYAFMIVYFSFTHKIKPKWNFVLASPTPVYFLGIFSVMWSFGTLEISRWVLLDLAILFVLVVIIIHIFRKFVKPAEESTGEGGFPKMPEEPGAGEEPSSLEGLGEGGEDEFGKMPSLK